MEKYNTKKELWKVVDDFPNYEISNLGRVYSRKSNKMLAIQVRKDGYNVVSLWKNNKGFNQYIHRLVLTHFLDGETKETVNHKDGNKSNNNLNNLEWMTYKENNIHAVETGLNTTEHKRNCKGSIKVEQWSDDGKLLEIFPSMRQAERETGIDATSIGHGIRKGWKYGGYVWKLHR